MARCRRRPESNAERTVSLHFEVELARCEEVLRVVVTALTFPFIVNALVPVPIWAEDASGAVQARNERWYVLVRVHRHAKRLAVFDVELSVHEWVRNGQRVDRPATDQRAQAQVGRRGEPFDRVSNPNRVGIVFEPKLAGECHPRKLVGPARQWLEAAQVIDASWLDGVAPVVAVQGDGFIADLEPFLDLGDHVQRLADSRLPDREKPVVLPSRAPIDRTHRKRTP